MTFDKVQDLEKRKKGEIKMDKKIVKQDEECTNFSIISPIGNISVDMKDFEQAKKEAYKQLNPPKLSFISKKINNFLGAEAQTDFNYYHSKIGSLMKLHIDHKFSDYHLVKEFLLEHKIEVPGSYSNVSISNSETQRYLQNGVRFYENEHEKVVVICSVDEYDNDEKITIMSAVKGRGLELLEELETSFYTTGALKNAFFDMEFNFINRSDTVEHLIAWNDEVKDQLDKDVLQFLKVMPILRQKGLPNSRGIILSGPPGTGKTMIAKSLAAQAKVTTILISAEMIKGKNEVKRIFRLGRKLAPTLIIIEDIDTAGTVSRKFTDHPILGEYLQALDGMETNDGMIILATTNHTENIDPAISDRPGRFDRIIDIPLPTKEQRSKIVKNILAKMPTEIIDDSVISELARKSDGLSGAWIREAVQSAFIEAIYQGKQTLDSINLKNGFKDVLKRRGMAYQSTPNLSLTIENKNAEVYTM